MLRNFTRLAARQPLATRQLISTPIARRCVSTINIKDFQPSSGFQKFSEDLETEIRKRVEALPPTGKLFTNVDGTARNPTDEELQQAAALSMLAKQSKDRITYPDYFKLSSEQMSLFQENQEDLAEYLSSGERILDKVPVQDKETGEVTWQVIREKQKEGWEGLMYYGYIPGALLCLFFALFLDKENISDWAMEELRLRAQERYNDGQDALVNDGTMSAEDVKKRDALIVERILSGEYDRLAGLKKAGSDMPSSLI